MSLRKDLFAVLFLIVVFPLSAQTAKLLTLEKSISLALHQSYQAQLLKENLTTSRMNLKAARAAFRSNGELRFSSLPNYQETERQTALAGGGFSFDRQQFMNMQGEVYFNQPIPQFDGTFSLVGVFQRFQQFGEYDEFITTGEGQTRVTRTDPVDFAPQLRLQYRQPLFTLNRLKTGVKKAELGLENTLQSYTRSQLDIVYSVTTGFYNLYRSQQQVDIDSAQVEQSRSAYRIGRLKYQAGLLPEVEVLRLEIDLANARNTLEASRALLERNADQFKLLVGLAQEEEIRVIADITWTPIEISLEKAMKEALARRTELHSDEINIELSRLNVQEVDAQREIKGELALRYGIFNRKDVIADAFRDFNNDRSVVISMTVPLWDWGRNQAQVEAAYASLRSAELERRNRVDQIKQEIRAAVRDLKSAQMRVEITQRSTELAEKSYRINLLKFETGDLSSQELALEQNRLTQARTNYLNAIIDYKQALADLRRKTLWDFEHNRPVDIDLPEL